MDFEHLLSRADEETLQTLLGSSAVRLIMLLDSSLATPTRLRELLLSLHKPEELLLSRFSRTMLFDLLRGDEASKLADALGISTSGDVYYQLKSCRLPRGSERERHLLQFFEISPLPLIEDRTVKPSVVSSLVEYGLFQHQRRAVRECISYLSEEPRRALLHMPTGSGKTRTAMNVVADHLRCQEPGIAVWLAHNEELCEQAAEEFQRAWASLGDRDVSIYRFWGQYSLDPESVKDGIVIAGLSKLYNAAKRSIEFISKLGSQCSLVIMDEAHQAIAETYKLILNSLFVLGHETGLLGMTATPGRTWADISADEKLSNFFARRKVTLNVPGYDNPVDYLISEGYLARATFSPLFDSYGTYLTNYDLKRIEEELEIPAKVLERLGENDKRNLVIVRAIEDLANRHQRMIVFATSVQHSNTLACALRARGSHADSLTGGTLPVERKRIITDFKDESKEIKILCNFGVLTTGFDAPRTSAALIARPTISLVLYSQMVGRAIRGPKAGGNTNAEVVTIVDQEIPGFGTIAQSFTNWEDVWKT